MKTRIRENMMQSILTAVLTIAALTVGQTAEATTKTVTYTLSRENEGTYDYWALTHSGDTPFDGTTTVEHQQETNSTQATFTLPDGFTLTFTWGSGAIITSIGSGGNTSYFQCQNKNVRFELSWGTHRYVTAVSVTDDQGNPSNLYSSGNASTHYEYNDNNCENGHVSYTLKTYASFVKLNITYSNAPDLSIFESAGTNKYNIKDKDDLRHLADYVNNGHNDCIGLTFLQTTDITCDNTYTPIGYYNNSNDKAEFCGTYDGDGNTISGITVKRTGDTNADGYIGIFGYIYYKTRNYGTVRNVVLANSTFTGYEYVGGIVGYNMGGIVENCRVEYDVTINTGANGANYHGGIVGKNYTPYANIIGCYSAATIWLNDKTGLNYGGIAGYNWDGTVKDCLYTGTTVEATNYKGAIVGFDESNKGIFTNNYYTKVNIGGVNGSDVSGVRRAYTVTFGENIVLSGDQTAYSTSRLTAIGTTALRYTPLPLEGSGEALYSGEGQTLTLGYTGSVPTGYCAAYSTTGGTISGNVLTMPAGDVTLSAYWTVNTYTVTLDNQGATTAGTTSVPATYDAAMPNITVPKRTGYTFGGYYTEINGGGTKYYNANGSSANNWNIASDATLYAYWTANTYTVTLDDSDATTHGTVSVPATYGAAMPNITAPKRTGYTFGGYYTEINGGGSKYYNADGTSAHNWDIASDATLYAYWTANTYTVTLYNQGAIFAGTTSVTATYDAAMPDITVPTEPGYNFNGYYTAANGGGIKYYNANGTSAKNWNIASDATLYAYWTLSTYTVTLDNQGATTAGTTSVIAPYAHAMPSITVPTRTGYIFEGYYTAVNGGGTKYYNANGKSVNNWDITSDATLYAYWIAVSLSGQGTQTDPYVIGSAHDWASFVDMTAISSLAGKFFRLDADISVSKMASPNESNSFSGNFNGNGHKITLTLSCDRYYTGDNEEDQGLALFHFAGNGCAIYNLTVDGTITTENKFAAGFISYITKGTVSNNKNIVLRNCRSSVSIKTARPGDVTSAGFVAMSKGYVNLTLEDCLFDGSFKSSSATQFAGFVGWQDIEGKTTIANSLVDPASIDLTPDGNHWTFCRCSTSNNLSLKNSYYRMAIGTPQGGGAWDTDNQSLKVNLGSGWTISGDKVVPKVYLPISGNGTKATPYIIGSADDWTLFVNTASNNSFADEYFRLDTDIDMNGVTDFKPFVFKGNFDGNNKTISHLTINSTSTQVGLFGVIDGGSVNDLTLSGATITGDDYVGGIAGQLLSGTIQNCKVVGSTITVNQETLPCVGAIVGFNNGGTLTSNTYHSTLVYAPNIPGTYYKAGGTAFHIGVGYDKNTSNPYGDVSGAELDATKLFLADNRNNADLIVAYADPANHIASGGTAPSFTSGIDVSLQGRTLYKDGAWNTLCLPFDVSTTSGPLSGDNVVAMTLDKASSGLSGTTLTLNFTAAETIPAGTPFIIKWGDNAGGSVTNNYNTGSVTNTNSDLENPVFPGVTIDNSASTEVSFTGGKFKGTFDPVSFNSEDKSILFLGGGNKLYYPDGTATTTINAFRAYFQLNDPTQVKEFKLSFDGEDSADGISLTPDPSPVGEGSNVGEDAIYNLAGQRLSKMQRGINIVNGKKILK